MILNEQCGIGIYNGNIKVPTRMILPKDINIKFVAQVDGNAEGIAKFLVTDENHIYAWGYNYYNTIDDTNAGTYPVPVKFQPTALLR